MVGKILFSKHDNLIKYFNDYYQKNKISDYEILFSEYNCDLNGYEGSISYKNKTMSFIFRPALEINLARTLVILHGHGANTSYSKFHDPNWNVIVPLDKFGTDNLGSWWLGENGNLDTFELLQNLLKSLKAYFKFSSWYFWGSSMGGYGAILHGFLLNASAIYSHIPQIKLYGTEYTDGVNSKFYSHLVSENTFKYLDLVKFINTQRVNKSPVLFLSQNSMDRKKYALDHFIPFIKRCDEIGLAYSVTMPLIKGHNQHISVAETVKTHFEHNYKKIKKWRIEGSI